MYAITTQIADIYHFNDKGEYCTQYIMDNYSLILNNVSIFVTTHKSMI